MAEIRTEETLIRVEAEDGTIGDAIINLSVQCLACKHLNDNMTTCKAFREGIPLKILTGGYDHTKPFKGDKGIKFVGMEEDVVVLSSDEEPEE